jgi:formate dehydrogenase major subunit
VQDIFMTETAWLADVVLPASAWPEKTGTVSNTDRMVQLGKAGARSAGDARPGSVDHPADRAAPWAWTGATRRGAGRPAVYDEMRQAMHAAISGITWERPAARGRA